MVTLLYYVTNIILHMILPFLIFRVEIYYNYVIFFIKADE